MQCRSISFSAKSLAIAAALSATLTSLATPLSVAAAPTSCAFVSGNYVVTAESEDRVVLSHNGAAVEVQAGDLGATAVPCAGGGISTDLVVTIPLGKADVRVLMGGWQSGQSVTIDQVATTSDDDTLSLVGPDGASTISQSASGVPALSAVNITNFVIEGGPGNDIIEVFRPVGMPACGVECTVVDGGDGDDTITVASSTAESSTQRGGRGNDFLTNGRYGGRLFGGPGADTLTGSMGSDEIYPGDDFDADSFNSGPSGPFPSWNGLDTLSYADAAAGIIVDLGTGVGGGAATNDNFGAGTLFTAQAFDYFVGSNFADSITGSANSDNLYGRLGDDTISGGGSRDYIAGAEGDDILNGGDGDDSVFGSGGDGGDGDNTVDGGDGNDEVYGGDGKDTVNGGNGNDDVGGGDGDDALNGGADDDRLYGGADDDSVTGGEGADTIHAGDGDDSLEAQAGNDRLWGDSGNDTLVGGDGDDVLIGGAGNDAFDGGAGNRDVIAFLDSPGSVTINLVRGTFKGMDSTDIDGVNVEGYGGTEFNDTITGGDTADTLFGFGGKDRISGGGGDDWLDGGGGLNAVNGGSGGADTCYSYDRARGWQFGLPGQAP